MTTAKQTDTDGAAGARFAAGVLGVAICAETTATTMAEDSAKVDVKFSFRHIAEPSKLITAHAQIKSGPSYRRTIKDQKHIALVLDKDTLKALSGGGMPGLVIWVPPPPMDRIYWYASNPRAENVSTRIPRTQFVRPSLRYDLTRLYDYSSWGQKYAKAMVRNTAASKVLLARAKTAYRELKATLWTNPLVGELKVSRLAWRHITRRSKSGARRDLSLRAVPYLKAFLSAPPDRYACHVDSIDQIGARTVETRFLICWYRQALIIDSVSHSLMLRIREEISFPTNWQDRPLATSEVKQVATLASWWCRADR